MSQPLDGFLDIVNDINNDEKEKLGISGSTQLWERLRGSAYRDAQKNNQPIDILLTGKDFSENWNNRMKQLELGNSLFSGYIKHLAVEIYGIVSSDRQFEDFLVPSEQTEERSKIVNMDRSYSSQVYRLSSVGRTFDAIATYNIAKGNYDLGTAYLSIGIQLAKKQLEIKNQGVIGNSRSINQYSTHLSTLELIEQHFPLPEKNKQQLAMLIKDPINTTGNINNMYNSEYYKTFENTINTIEESPIIQQSYKFNKSFFDKEETLQIGKDIYAMGMIRTGEKTYTDEEKQNIIESIYGNKLAFFGRFFKLLAPENNGIVRWLGAHSMQNIGGLILINNLAPRSEGVSDRIITTENKRQQVYQEFVSRK